MAWHHQRHSLNLPQVSLHHCNTDRVCISRVTLSQQTRRDRRRVSSKVRRRTQVGNSELAFQPEFRCEHGPVTTQDKHKMK